MGLDIRVYKIIKEKSDNYIKCTDNKGNYRYDFPEWTKQFEQEAIEYWYDWEKYKNDTGIDIADCQFIGEEIDDNVDILTVWPKSAGEYPNIHDFKLDEDNYDWDAYYNTKNAHIIKINLDDVPLYEKSIKVLYIKEIGYQRKGLNNQFYQDCDDGKIGSYVWTKKELKRYKKDYCDKPYEPVLANGEKSGVIVRPKQDFQRNIIDKFVEGECVATFDW